VLPPEIATRKRQVIDSNNSGLFSQFARTSDRLVPAEEDSFELIEDRDHLCGIVVRVSYYISGFDSRPYQIF
jgi:hypothetical protein